MDLVTVAEELYGLVPAEFTAARNDRAKAVAADDKVLADGIRRLPKPSAAAWTVNMLARHRPDEVAGAVELGARLREAQEALDRHEITALGQKRHALIAEIARGALTLAGELGNPVNAAALGDVEQTLQAAMADPDAARAVQSGRLVRALTSTGFEPPDLTDAVAAPTTQMRTATDADADTDATPSAGPSSGRLPEKAGPDRRRLEAERRLAAARQSLGDAERQADAARSELGAIERRIADLGPLRGQLAAELYELQERTAEVVRDAAAVDREARTLGQERDKARRAVDAATRNLGRARDALEGR